MTNGKYIDILKRRGFFCFFWTQFLGAFNDNFYKIIVILLALDTPQAAGGGSQYIPLIGALFILPFLLFSGYAGYLADVHSKRNVLVTVKFFEIAAMGLGLVRFSLALVAPADTGTALAADCMARLHGEFGCHHVAMDVRAWAR